MNPSAELASFVFQVLDEDMPLNVVNRARQIIIDTIACAIGGYSVAAEECAWIIEVVKDLGGTPEATVWFDGLRTASLHAALANGTMAHTIDFDDTHVDSIAHLGASLVPAAIAVAEKTGSSGRQVLTALIAGFEVAARVGKCVGLAHYQYWHPTATIGTIGSAAVAAKLMGLTASQIEQAIGLAVDQAAGFRYCIDKGDFSKSLHAGWAAMRGIMSAMIISKGANGPKGLLEYETGFCKAMSGSPDLAELTKGLGEEFAILRDAIKLYPTIHCSHTGIEAVLELVLEHDLKAEEVEAIEVKMTELPKGQGMNYHPATPLAARLSIPFCLASAVIKRKVTLDEFSAGDLENPEVRNLMNKIMITPKNEFNKQYPGTFVSLVTIRTRENKQYEKFITHPKGHPERPASDEDILDKFRSLASRKWPAEKINSLLETLLEFEKLPSIKNLVEKF